MKLIHVAFIVLISSILIQAQESSSYSRYGIGDLDYGYSPKMLALGDIGVTQLDPEHIVITNPASWAVLNRTRIELSLGYKGVSISDGSRSAFSSETELRGITLGFPVSRDYGVGLVIGMVPFSRISYLAEKTFSSPLEGVPSYKVTYEGSGGLSKFFVGTSYTLPAGIHLGASFDYYFGNQNYFSDIEFDEGSSNINTSFENNRSSDAVGTTIGIISPNLAKDFNFGLFSNLRLGVSVSLISEMNTDTLFSASSLSLIDTIAFSSVKTSVPYRLNSGISFAFNEIHNLSLEYMYQPWSSYEFDERSSEFLRDAAKISLGYEYVPKRSAGLSVWELMVWRAGVSYEQTQYKFRGQGIDQYAFYGGFSFPIGIDNTVDIALQYGIRGTNENNLIKENFVKLYLGVSFGELWFLRYEK